MMKSDFKQNCYFKMIERKIEILLWSSWPMLSDFYAKLIAPYLAISFH